MVGTSLDAGAGFLVYVAALHTITHFGVLMGSPFCAALVVDLILLPAFYVLRTVIGRKSSSLV